MSPDSTPTKVCPTCGTRLGENATRCLVCGRNFSPASNLPKSAATSRTVNSPKLPEIKLSLPVAIGLVLLMIGLGAVIVYAILSGNKGSATTPGAEITATPSNTPTLTATPTDMPTATITFTPSPQPPIDYKVLSGDVCSSIALKFGVTVDSISKINNLPADCGFLVEGQSLKIPVPTPTPPPPPTATLSGQEATDQACGKVEYIVKENDTIGGIARAYNIDLEALKLANAMLNDNIYSGMYLKIPLCQRLPTPGPTPTATLPPPYQAPNLLLPIDGTMFNFVDDVSLQWSAIGPLREGESYAVIIEDVSGGEGVRLVTYVSDTKLIVPVSMKPKDGKAHIYRWSVTAARQKGTTTDGQPIWDPAGAISVPRVFGWSAGGPVGTPAP